MKKKLNILTFNWHEAYLCMLSKTGHDFDIVERLKGGSSDWFYQTRPVPLNATIINLKTAMIRLREGQYDMIICHNFKDIAETKESNIPKVLVFHNMLTTELALGGNKHTKEEYLKSVHEMIGDVSNLHAVFISDLKKNDWGIGGSVITPGIDLTEYSGYRGDLEMVLRIGNFMEKRDIMMGYTHQEEILKDIPNVLLGINEAALNRRFTESWDDLKNEFIFNRVYLNSCVNEFEDGYNLATLEAMATGMPVVSTFNKTSPIKDGYNGFISTDFNYLRAKVKELLFDKELAVSLGENARKTVKDKFSINDFIDKWNSLLLDTVTTEPKRFDTLFKKSSKNILINYVSYPVTTARYIDDALRKEHNVISSGPAITPLVIKAWNLENMKEDVKPQDFPCKPDETICDFIKKIPDYKYPDLFLWVESMNENFPKGISNLNIPTACYMIDSHMNLHWHTDWAKNFDFVFLAQREYISDFKKAGCSNVSWLPLACDPFFHKKKEVKKENDICFIGSVTENHVRRKRLLDMLSEKFSVFIDRRFLHEMSEAFSKAKIVFNESIRNDLNMRVFEGLASGSLLFTDDPNGSGLTDFFEDKKHLVIFEEENILDLVRYYLEHDKEREDIAKVGMNEVLKNHTYDIRVKAMMDKIFNQPLIEQRLNSKNRDSVSVPDISKETLSKLSYVLDKNIDDRETVKALYNVAVSLKEYGLIRKYLEKYLSLHPADLDILIDLCNVFINLENFVLARENIEKVLMFDSENKRAKELQLIITC